MSQASPNGVPEIHVMSLIPESDSFTLASANDSASLMLDGGSTISFKNAEARAGHVRRNSTGNVDIPYATATILSCYLSVSSGSCRDNCIYDKIENVETKTMNLRSNRNTEMQRRGQVRQDMKNPESPGIRKKNVLSSDVRPQKPDILVPGNRELLKKLGLSKRLTIRTKATTGVPATRGNHVGSKHGRSKPYSSLLRRSSTSKEDGVIQNDKETGKLPTKSPKASGSKKKGLSRTISVSAINSVKKALMRPLISLSQKRSSKRVSSKNPMGFKKLESISRLWDKSDRGKSAKPTMEDVPEKTLHVIDESRFEQRNSKTQNQNDILGSKFDSPSTNKEQVQVCPSPVSSVASLESSKSIDDRKSETSMVENKTRNTKAEHKFTRTKDGVTNAKHKDSPEKKLSFWNGGVIELPSEIKTSRRQKYRRTLSDIPIRKVESIKQLRSMSFNGSDTNIAEIETGSKVVQKCVDVKEKKDAQNLLNNVIEETASKLAETRKSKVKALVGAFETVISLQDSKPSSTVAAS